MRGGPRTSPEQQGLVGCFAFEWIVLFPFVEHPLLVVLGAFEGHDLCDHDLRTQFLEGVHLREGRFKDVSWLSPNGREMGEAQWKDPRRQAFGMLLDSTGVAVAGTESPAASCLVLFNSGDHPAEFTLPAPISAQLWEVVMDTSQETGSVPAGSYRKGHVYALAESSMAVLVERVRN